jgi:NTE family protein
LTAALAQRLAETATVLPDRPDARPRTICLIRAGGARLPEEFARLLSEVFRDGARTLVVNSSNARELLAGNALFDSAEATRSLNALESRYDHILFVADHEVTPWTEKAIRHADLILMAGRHDADPTPNALEALAAQFVASEARRLVLIHDTKGRVQGTSRWLRDRNVTMHHHVALDDKRDVERLFRFINGTAVGLVACGGGAFCAAHVGVYKALTEMNVGFDIMGGTSAGSAMVAAFALGTEPDEIDRSLHDMFVAHKAMRRYTWPRYSILDHTNFDRQLKRYFDGFDIEDLWLPYFAVSTNLSRFRLNQHRTGSLWTAIRASSSIPVLLPPVYTHDGEMLVDGCLLDNVPVRTMQDIKSGPNVVVSFAIPELERFDVAYETLPSRAELVRLALNPMKRDALPAAPGLIPVLLRSLMASRRDFQRDLASDDVLLVPPVPKNMGFLDWQRHRELCDGAYRWTLEEVARLREQGRPPWIGSGRAGHTQ